MGGPFIKDKLFYFFTYDGFRRVGRVLYSDTNNISLTPTAGNTGGTVISPTQCPSTITSQMCNAGITFLMQVANIEPGQASPSRYAKQDLLFPRIDYHINSKNDAFVDFNFANFSSTNGYSPAPTFTNRSPSRIGHIGYLPRWLGRRERNVQSRQREPGRGLIVCPWALGCSITISSRVCRKAPTTAAREFVG